MIILDIETVPSHPKELIYYHKYLTSFDKMLSSFAKASEKPTPENISSMLEFHETVLKKASIDYVLGQICSISIIVPKQRKKEEVITKTFFNTDEEKLLNEFWDFIRDKQILPQTITYNGIAFDLPWLFFRSMKYEIIMPWHDVTLKRFATWPNCDIMQLACWWDSYSKAKTLGHLARAFGYDVNPLNCDKGSEVCKNYMTKNYDWIIQHNMEDCKKTLFLYRKLRTYFPQPPKIINKYGKDAY